MLMGRKAQLVFTVGTPASVALINSIPAEGLPGCPGFCCLFLLWTIFSPVHVKVHFRHILHLIHEQYSTFILFSLGAGAEISTEIKFSSES